MRLTDWNAYYDRPFPLARLTRRYTAWRLATVLRRQRAAAHPLSFVELGGADSAFAATLIAQFAVRRYLAVDTNVPGLQRFARRPRARAQFAHQDGSRRAVAASVLGELPRCDADVVLSVGLIEHFTGDAVRHVVAAHYACARPGGTVVISFPTPTMLYRGARAAAERLGQWRFPDEQPLTIETVESYLAEGGRVAHREILWPLVYTQALLVATKHMHGDH